MFSVDAQKLKTILPTLKKGNTKSLLNVIHIWGKGGFVHFETTNYDVHVRQTLRSDNLDEAVDFVVGFTAFEKVISGMDKQVETISFEVEAEKVTIVTGPLSTKLPLAKNGHVFPDFATLEGVYTLQFSSEEFCSGCDSVQYAVAKDDTRPALSGIYLEFIGGKLRFTGCDGFRAAQSTVDLIPDLRFIAIPPFSAITKYLDVLPNKHSLLLELSFSDSKSGLLFQYVDYGLSIWMRTVDADYPNLELVVPKEFSASITVNLQRIIDGVKMVTAKEKDRQIQFTLERIDHDELLNIAGLASAEIESETSWSYGPVNITYPKRVTTTADSELLQDLDAVMHSFSAITVKSQFLAEALSKIKSTHLFQNVVLNFSGNVKPLVIHGVDGAENRAIIMPMTGRY